MLGGTLYFNKTSHSFVSESKTAIRGEGNQHDESKGVDLKIGEDYVKNGFDNYFPFDIEETAKRSLLQKRAFLTITNIVNGRLVFQGEDGKAITPQRQKQLIELYKSVGITNHAFISPCVQSNYLQGGSFNCLEFGSNGRGMALSSVTNRQYKTGRLSFPMWKNNQYFYDKHFYHRNWGYRYEGKSRKQSVSTKTLSWLDWNKDPKKNFDEACFVYSYDKERKLTDEVNRLQSVMIGGFDGLSDHYPTPSWYTATTFNYERAEFFLSCFDVDDIENGFHASGLVKVFHEAYNDPETGEAKTTFEQQAEEVRAKLKGSYNSGAVVIVPVGINSEGRTTATNGSMEFEAFKTNSDKGRHDTFDLRIKNNILTANNIIMPELIGVRDEKSTLSEGGDKLINAVNLLNQFVVIPQKALLDDPQSGFLNAIINPLLGITERAVIIPNLSFLSVSESLAKHYMHPDEWYKMMAAYGLNAPTSEQIASGLIPAYSKEFINKPTAK